MNPQPRHNEPGQDRHHRQRLLPMVGDAGQDRLRRAHATIVGCGALGSAVAESLCRAGVGTLTIIDRDVVELTNLQRQTLFTEDHAREGLPKAVAAKRALAQIDSSAVVHALVDDLNPDTVDRLLAPLPSGEGWGEEADSDTAQRAVPPRHPLPPGEDWGEGHVQTQLRELCHPDPLSPRERAGERASALPPPVAVLIDCADNFETRFLLNDLAVRQGSPLVYAGVVGATGLITTVLPRLTGETPARLTSAQLGELCHPDSLSHRERAGVRGAPSMPSVEQNRHNLWQPTACLRCLFDAAPAAGSAPTCDTAGVLGPAVAIIAGFQTVEAMKILLGRFEDVNRSLLEVDAWSGRVRRIDTTGARRDDCPCCAMREFVYLDGAGYSRTTTLCGSDAVQISPRVRAAIDLDALARRLAPHGRFTSNGLLLRGRFNDERGEQGDAIEITIFSTGRAIIKGTATPRRARTLYARYLGA